MSRFGPVYYPPKYTKWKKQAEAMIRQHVQQAMQGPLAVECVFLFAVPKSYSKRERESALNGVVWPRPDCDNTAKAILDAMTGAGVWCDDSQVVRLVASKRYAERDEIQVKVATAIAS